MKLHIIQGGIENGDKAWLERAARRHLTSGASWVVPKNAEIGDRVVIYVGRFGFFATARVATVPEPRRGWPNRYGAALSKIRLIRPAISVATVRRHLPALTWAIYPRSITTPDPRLAERILRLVQRRRSTGLPDLDGKAMRAANRDELRALALLKARRRSIARSAKTVYRVRSRAIRLYILHRAEGRCEGCSAGAPFSTREGLPYLEPHHITRLADEGPDHPGRVAALCPNCHRRAHYAGDARDFNRMLRSKIARLERRAAGSRK